jgi:two-component system cell cycle response regulator DivK
LNKIIKKQKILVAEDNISLLEPIKIVLESADYSVIAISDGTTIINKMEKYLPKLLLLDISMGVTDGRDVCKYLKSKEKTEKIPIVLMSAHSDIKKIAEYAGADGYISKPFDIEGLLQIIKKYLSIKKPA